MSVLGMQEVAWSATKVRELVDFGPFPPDFGSILGQECLRDSDGQISRTGLLTCFDILFERSQLLFTHTSVLNSCTFCQVD